MHHNLLDPAVLLIHPHPAMHAARTQTAKTEVAVKDALDRVDRGAHFVHHGGSAGNAIREAMLGAQEAAREAEAAAAEGEKAVEAAREQTWQAAITEGQRAMQRVVDEAQAKAKAEAKRLERLTNTNEIKASQAAAKASEPYFTSMLRAQRTVQDYRAKGTENAALANKLEAEARDLEKEANEEKQAGDVAGANAKIANAREVMEQAQEYGKQAAQNFAVAEDVGKSLPKYQAAAQAAAAKAAYDANPAWQPPPPMAR